MAVQINGAVSKEVKSYNMYKGVHGLPDIGTEIEIAGKIYTLEGFNNRKRINKLIIKKVANQKTYYVSIEMAGF